MDFRIDVLKQITAYTHPKPKEIDMEKSPEQSVKNAEQAMKVLKELESHGQLQP